MVQEPLGFDDAVGRKSGRLDRGRHRPGVRGLEQGQAGVLGGDDDRADVPRVIGHPGRSLRGRDNRPDIGAGEVPLDEEVPPTAVDHRRGG
jgi:hypothetical protein